MIYPLKIVIFYSYVKLPEGKSPAAPADDTGGNPATGRLPRHQFISKDLKEVLEVHFLPGKFSDGTTHKKGCHGKRSAIGYYHDEINHSL